MTSTTSESSLSLMGSAPRRALFLKCKNEPQAVAKDINDRVFKLFGDLPIGLYNAIILSASKGHDSASDSIEQQIARIFEAKGGQSPSPANAASLAIEKALDDVVNAAIAAYLDGRLRHQRNTFDLNFSAKDFDKFYAEGNPDALAQLKAVFESHLGTQTNFYSIVSENPEGVFSELKQQVRNALLSKIKEMREARISRHCVDRVELIYTGGLYNQMSREARTLISAATAMSLGSALDVHHNDVEGAKYTVPELRGEHATEMLKRIQEHKNLAAQIIEAFGIYVPDRAELHAAWERDQVYNAGRGRRHDGFNIGGGSITPSDNFVLRPRHRSLHDDYPLMRAAYFFAGYGLGGGFD